MSVLCATPPPGLVLPVCPLPWTHRRATHALSAVISISSQVISAAKAGGADAGAGADADADADRDVVGDGAMLGVPASCCCCER